MAESLTKLLNDLITYLFLGYIVYRIFNYAELRLEVLHARAWSIMKLRVNHKQGEQTNESAIQRIA